MQQTMQIKAAIDAAVGAHSLWRLSAKGPRVKRNRSVSVHKHGQT